MRARKQLQICQGQFNSARWKTRGRGPGVRGPGVWKTRGVENAGCGKRGVWKTRSVENAECGKRGVWWKTRGLVENAGSCGKRGVWWKTRGLVENAGSGGKRGVWWETRGLSGKHGETEVSSLN